MQAYYEWQIPAPDPDGTVSVVVRMTTAEAAALVAAPAQTDQVAVDVQTALQGAAAAGELVLP